MTKERLGTLLMNATLGTSGLDVIIICSDHDTKDAIFDALEALVETEEDPV